MKATKSANAPLWEVPYLPIDPKDVGRSYEAIIRINSQSGKGGIAYILQADYGLNLPRAMQVDFREDIQRITDEEGRELPAKRIHEQFMERYVDQPEARVAFVDHMSRLDGDRARRVIEATIRDGTAETTIEGRGSGAIEGFIDALNRHLGLDMSVVDYSEHSLGKGSDARAITYMEIEHEGGRVFGAGIDQNAVTSSLKAIVSAANRILAG